MMLRHLILAYRKQNNLGVRTLATIIGVSHTCLYRFEQGSAIKAPQLEMIWKWLLLGDTDVRKSERNA
jgi:predicted transcriptional regulator